MNVPAPLSGRIWRLYSPDWLFSHSFSAGSAAWAVMGLSIIVYNLKAKEGEMLSEQADRWIERHPVAARAAVGVVAAHVANAAPQRLDPIHFMFTILRRPRGDCRL